MKKVPTLFLTKWPEQSDLDLLDKLARKFWRNPTEKNSEALYSELRFFGFSKKDWEKAKEKCKPG